MKLYFESENRQNLYIIFLRDPYSHSVDVSKQFKKISFWCIYDWK